MGRRVIIIDDIADKPKESGAGGAICCCILLLLLASMSKCGDGNRAEDVVPRSSVSSAAVIAPDARPVDLSRSVPRP